MNIIKNMINFIFLNRKYYNIIYIYISNDFLFISQIKYNIT